MTEALRDTRRSQNTRSRDWEAAARALSPRTPIEGDDLAAAWRVMSLGRGNRSGPLGSASPPATTVSTPRWRS
jgi:hypothetical protein